ncbi:MAG: hypothetical protein Q7T61_21040 [Caulobacter sp.]|nr:hypothetical protein [Caulobacter sp.]
MITITDDDTDLLDAASVEDLYGHLGGADDTARPEAVSPSLTALHASAKAAEPGLLSDLAAKGKALFEKYWPLARDKVCDLYADDGGQGDRKGWIAKAAAAIASALNLSATVAVLVIGIAIKLGLDALCGTQRAPA